MGIIFNSFLQEHCWLGWGQTSRRFCRRTIVIKICLTVPCSFSSLLFFLLGCLCLIQVLHLLVISDEIKILRVLRCKIFNHASFTDELNRQTLLDSLIGVRRKENTSIREPILALICLELVYYVDFITSDVLQGWNVLAVPLCAIGLLLILVIPKEPVVLFCNVAIVEHSETAAFVVSTQSLLVKLGGCWGKYFRLWCLTWLLVQPGAFLHGVWSDLGALGRAFVADLDLVDCALWPIEFEGQFLLPWNVFFMLVALWTWDYWVVRSRINYSWLLPFVLVMLSKATKRWTSKWYLWVWVPVAS